MPYRLRNARADDKRVKKDHPPPENPALSANMKRLMDGRSVQTLREQMGEAGLPIGTETIHRAMLGKSGNRLESLTKIAAFFGVTADQLLQPGLGADLTDWPFSQELLARVRELGPEDRARFEKRIARELTYIMEERQDQQSTMDLEESSEPVQRKVSSKTP
jgi:hypothetical protein